jgi:hypothetical protein
LDFADPAGVVNELRAQPKVRLTGISKGRGFARVQINEGPDDISDANDVRAILDDMKQRHVILDYAEALIQKDASNNPLYTIYYLPGVFALRLTKQYLESQPRTPLLSDQESRFLAAKNLGHPVFERWMGGLFVLPLPKGKSGLSGLSDTIATYNADPNTKWVDVVQVGFNDPMRIEPNENYYTNDYWGLKTCKVVRKGNPAPPDAWNHSNMGANGSNGVQQVKIAVIDTGVENGHPDLGTTEGGTGSMENRDGKDWDFANRTDGVPSDESSGGYGGHGTNVIGVIGANSPNATGAVGVAPGCKVIPLRVDLGVTDGGTYIERADAINYIGSDVSFIDKWGDQRGQGLAVLNPNNRYIINLSWIMTGPCDAVRDAIAEAVANNVLVVAAAGDTLVGGVDINTSPIYPACYPSVIPVGSVDSAGNKPSTSNYGNGTIKVIFAPNNFYTTALGSSYVIASGTSVSAAFVSGIASLVYTANYMSSTTTPKSFNKSAAQVRAIIMDPTNCNMTTGLTGKGIGRTDANLCVADARF